MKIRKIMIALAVVATSVLTSAIAFAQEVAGAANAGDGGIGMKFLACALVIAIPAAGGAIGQSIAAAAALEGIARNPSASGKVFTPMILGLALIESLVIYALIIAFILIGKL